VIKSPQTHEICERFHKAVKDEFYQATFRKKMYRELESLQFDLDQWIEYYNNERIHQGKWKEILDIADMKPKSALET
jgi:transposase InsO family protein